MCSTPLLHFIYIVHCFILIILIVLTFFPPFLWGGGGSGAGGVEIIPFAHDKHLESRTMGAMNLKEEHSDTITF